MQHVLVSRDLDDHRTVLVPADQLRTPHLATDCGGRMRRLALPALAVYMDCSLIPSGVPFGHECKHRGDRPCSIKVMVREDLSDPDACADLRDRARHFKPSQRRPAKVAATLAPARPA